MTNDEKTIREGRRFRKMFERIITEGLPIYTNNSYTERYMIQEGEEFRQVWTDDINAKYYECRHQIAPYYFISNYGSIASMYGDRACLVNPSVSVLNNHFRLYFDTQTTGDASIKLTPEHLVTLAFDGDADSEALRIMKLYGLDAFRRNTAKEEGYIPVQMHHKDGHKDADTPEGQMALNQENCQLDGLQFLCRDLHDRITNQPENNEFSTNVKHLDSINNVCESHGLDKHTVAFWGDDRGEITEYPQGFGKVKFKDGLGQFMLSIEPYNDEAKRAPKKKQIKDIEWIQTDTLAQNAILESLKEEKRLTIEARWNSGRAYLVGIDYAHN